MQSKGSPDVRNCRLVALQSQGQGSAVRRRVPDYLTIATVLAPWGMQGELKVRLETDFPERFARLTRVYLGAEREPFDFEAFRLHKGYGLLKLKGYDTRDAVERLRGLEVQIPLQEAMPLGPGRYYAYQIEGLQVWTEEGELLGSVEEVLFTGSNPVYVTQGPRGEVLIPALQDVVLAVDLEAGRLVVRLPAGLLD